MFKKSLG